MRNIITLLIAIVSTGTLYAQGQLTVNQQAVQQTIIKLFDALSNRDSLSLKAYSTADISLYEYGQVWNMDTLILKAITQNNSVDFNRTNSFEFINTNVSKSTAWVTYRLQSIIVVDSKQTTKHWLETVVLAREKNKWKVKHLHSTRIQRT